MQVVIEISEKLYDLLKKFDDEKCTREMLMIKRGTPLPKGHGRLIDADALEECKEIMNTISGESKYAVRMDDIRNMPTTIEAEQCDDDCEHCEWATCPKMEVGE